MTQYSRSFWNTRAQPASFMWNLSVRYMLRMAGKLSGFLSKKYSGGLPGTYSSQNSNFFSRVVAIISFPSLVVGYLFRVFFRAKNLSPPTSSMTLFLRLAAMVALSLPSLVVGYLFRVFF